MQETLAEPAARVGRRGWTLALAALAGLGLSFAQPPWGLWPLVFPAVAALAFMHGRAGAQQAGWLGLAAGTAYFGAGLYWIAEAFFVDAARHGWMAPFAVLFMAVGMALFWALPFRIAARHPTRPALQPLWLAALWAAAEFARANILTGFPWALSAYAWVETPLAQVSSLIGPHGLGLVTLLAACALALPGRRLRPLALLPALALLALLTLGWVWGSQRLSQAGLPAETGLRIRLVQPNAAQDKKWQPELVGMFLDRQLAASAAEPRADVVIWPETAVPWLLQEEPELRARIATAARGATVILGARRLEERPGQPRAWFNSLFVLGPDGAIAASYDKHHLVPFGEYLPFSALFDRLGLTGLVGGSFSPGPGPKVIDGQGLPGFRPLICYEAIFPDEMPADTRPAWLVQITNDAWFGSSIGPYQHFAQARMRAIEQGLPLARAANTGISAMIDPLGRIVASQPLGTQGFVDAILPSALPPTLYSRLRDWPFLAALLGLVVICITLRPRKDPSY